MKEKLVDVVTGMLHVIAVFISAFMAILTMGFIIYYGVGAPFRMLMIYLNTGQKDDYHNYMISIPITVIWLGFIVYVLFKMITYIDKLGGSK